MNENTYPPEVQALLDLAVDAIGCVSDEFDRAVDAYRKSVAPPEPFEAFLHGVEAVAMDPHNGYWYIDLRGGPDCDGDVVYRCTVTPVERVR